jgi:hypothetical protein
MHERKHPKSNTLVSTKAAAQDVVPSGHGLQMGMYLRSASLVHMAKSNERSKRDPLHGVLSRVLHGSLQMHAKPAGVSPAVLD